MAHKVTLIPGDGIGPEVTGAAVRIIENTGVKLDEALGKRYVAFKDPDRISWEFYSA